MTLAILSLVFSIIGLTIWFAVFQAFELNWIAWVIQLLGVVFGILAIRFNSEQRAVIYWSASFGIGISALGLLLSVIRFAVLVRIFNF